MPIYEFYCRNCHTIYNFFARSAKPYQDPACPSCHRKPLEKKLSRFAISSGQKDPTNQDNASDIDESRMEQAMLSMADQFDQVNENDPRAMAAVMRQLFQASGMHPNETIQEAMRRMEAGQDPDKIEEELGSELDAVDPDAMFDQPTSTLGRIRRLLEPPNVDPNLYDLT